MDLYHPYAGSTAYPASKIRSGLTICANCVIAISEAGNLAYGVDKVIKRIAGWKGRLLAYGERLTLINSCLASIPTYLMYIIKFPKWAIKLINSQMSHFSRITLRKSISITYPIGI